MPSQVKLPPFAPSAPEDESDMLLGLRPSKIAADNLDAALRDIRERELAAAADTRICLS